MILTNATATDATLGGKGGIKDIKDPRGDNINEGYSACENLGGKPGERRDIEQRIAGVKSGKTGELMSPAK